MKGIKKSIFITTVLMVVLTVVAVSTATLAWFSASDTVSVTQTTITAANSTTASIGIGWSVQEARTGYRISFANPGTDTLFNPVMPYKNPRTQASTAAEDFAYYISTNVEHTGITAGIVAGGVNGKTYARVYADEVVAEGRSVSLTDSVNYVEDAAIYDKIYKTVQEVNDDVVVYTNLANVPIDVAFAKIDANGKQADEGYDYLTIVAENPTGAQITVDAANALNPVSGVVAEGCLLYRKAKIDAEYAKVPYGSSRGVGTFIPNGMKIVVGENTIESDYVYVVESVVDGVGQLSEGENYTDITVTEAKSFITTPALQAKDGEFIYAIEKEVSGQNLPATFRSDFTFVESIIDGQGRFKSDGTPVAGVPLKNEAGNAQNFYIRNNGAQTAAIEVTANITGANASRLRVAVFVNGTYLGTIADAERETVYGAIVQGEYQDATLSYTASAGKLTIGELAADASYEITVFTWYDGKSLTATEGGGQQAQFSLDFNATQVAG